MSDFSLFSLFTAGLACMVPLAAAYTQPVGAEPKGNPISQPGLNSVVPAGEPFTIEWQPTTQGTVTLVLLKGPSSNAVPQYPIVEKTENNGTYVWTPSTDLAPSENAMGYGIQLIVDSDGQYQYTTQFGISNPDYKEPKSSSSEAPVPTSYSASKSATESMTMSAPGYSHTTTDAPHYTTAYYTHFTTYCPEATTFAVNNHTYSVTKATTLTISDCSCTMTKAMTSSWVPKPTGYSSMTKPVANVTMVSPTAYMPTTIKTSASLYSAPSSGSSSTASASVPAYTGGSVKMASSIVGLVAAAGAAVFAM